MLPCIHACQAGKDVYAEKPLTLYIREGRVLVDAVRQLPAASSRSATQQRSMAMNRIACELIRTGGLGKVLEVRAVNYSGPRESPSRGASARADAGRAGLGRVVEPGRWRPFNKQWMNWMRWRDFAGGEMTNWGHTASIKSSGRWAWTGPARWRCGP